jgi:CRP/FNR family transcriptional regulator, cyclic AMP receptor protein
VDLDSLRQKMLFLGLSDGQLQSIGSIMRKRTYREGDEVIRRGDLDDTLYVIEKGSVELRVPDPEDVDQVISVFEKGSYVDEGYAGDFFGEFSLVGLEPWNATVTARERTALLQLKRDELYELFSRDIDLQIGMILNIARVLSRRLRLRNRQG